MSKKDSGSSTLWGSFTSGLTATVAAAASLVSTPKIAPELLSADFTILMTNLAEKSTLDKSVRKQLAEELIRGRKDITFDQVRQIYGVLFTTPDERSELGINRENVLMAACKFRPDRREEFLKGYQSVIASAETLNTEGMLELLRTDIANEALAESVFEAVSKKKGGGKSWLDEYLSSLDIGELFAISSTIRSGDIQEAVKAKSYAAAAEKLKEADINISVALLSGIDFEISGLSSETGKTSKLVEAERKKAYVLSSIDSRKDLLADLRTIAPEQFEKLALLDGLPNLKKYAAEIKAEREREAAEQDKTAARSKKEEIKRSLKEVVQGTIKDSEALNKDPESLKAYFSELPEKDQRSFTDQFVKKRMDAEVSTSYEFLRTVASAAKPESGISANSLILNYLHEEKNQEKISNFLDNLGDIPKDKQIELLELISKTSGLEKESVEKLVAKCSEEARSKFLSGKDAKTVLAFLSKLPQGAKSLAEECRNFAIESRTKDKSFDEIVKVLSDFGDRNPTSSALQNLAQAYNEAEGDDKTTKKAELLEVCSRSSISSGIVATVIKAIPESEREAFSLEVLASRTKHKSFEEIEREAQGLDLDDHEIYRLSVAAYHETSTLDRSSKLSSLAAGLDMERKLELAKIADLSLSDAESIGIKTKEEIGALLSVLSNKEKIDLESLANNVTTQDCKDFAKIADINPDLAAKLAERALKDPDISLDDKLEMHFIKGGKKPIQNSELAIIKCDHILRENPDLNNIVQILSKGDSKLFEKAQDARKFVIEYADLNGIKVNKTFIEKVSGFVTNLFTTKEQRQANFHKLKEPIKGEHSPGLTHYRVADGKYPEEVGAKMAELSKKKTKELIADLKALRSTDGVQTLTAQGLDEITHVAAEKENRIKALEALIKERGGPNPLTLIEKCIEAQLESIAHPGHKGYRKAAYKATQNLAAFSTETKTIAGAIQQRAYSIEALEDRCNAERWLRDSVDRAVEVLGGHSKERKIKDEIGRLKERMEKYASTPEADDLEKSLNAAYGMKSEKEIAEQAIRESIDRIKSLDHEIGAVFERMDFVSKPDKEVMAQYSIALGEANKIAAERQTTPEDREAKVTEEKEVKRNALSEAMLHLDIKDDKVLEAALEIDTRKRKLEASIRKMEEGTLSGDAGIKRLFESFKSEKSDKTSLSNQISERLGLSYKLEPDAVEVLISVMEVKAKQVKGEELSDAEVKRIGYFQNNLDMLIEELDKIKPEWQEKMDVAVAKIEAGKGKPVDAADKSSSEAKTTETALASRFADAARYASNGLASLLGVFNNSRKDEASRVGPVASKEARTAGEALRESVSPGVVVGTHGRSRARSDPKVVTRE